MPPRRIGLFGGSFDPPHLAHLALARTARDELSLDELRWIPAGHPWQKRRRLSPAADREAMVRAAIAGEARMSVDPTELRREGPSYMIDTVAASQQREPGAQWFLVIGADQYAGLHTWHRWPDLLDRTVLAVANRPGPMPPVHADVLRHPHRVLPLPMLDVASTTIRARVARGEPIDDLVPPEVASYIARHRLYAEEGNAH